VLTIFSCPKPFSGQTGVIQRNAIRSWTLLTPSPEILLMGGEEGSQAVARECGAECVEAVATNQRGTPLISAMFQVAQATASESILCYVNADIIMTSDLTKVVAWIVDRDMDSFLLVGRRRTIAITEPMAFASGWEHELRYELCAKTPLDPPSAIDYMVFPKGLFADIPDFAVGRPRWDNWMLWYAAKHNVPLIDCTESLFAVHQCHDYAHLGQNGITGSQQANPEQRMNERLIGKWWPLRMYNIHDADYVLTDDGLSRAPARRRRHTRAERLASCVAAGLNRHKSITWPLLVCGRRVKTLCEHRMEHR
jgi:hypothetical protein